MAESQAHGGANLDTTLYVARVAREKGRLLSGSDAALRTSLTSHGGERCLLPMRRVTVTLCIQTWFHNPNEVRGSPQCLEYLCRLGAFFILRSHSA